MLHTIYSNYFEVLEACLVENLKAEACRPEAVFETQEIIIPSLAAADRLRLDIAAQTGICCGYEFEFIGAWFEKMTGVESANEHTSQSLVWPLWRLLRDGAFTSRFPALRRYVEGKSASEIYDFAQRVADIFRRYIAYRLDRVLEWIGVQQGGAESELRRRETEALRAHPDYAWQRALWEKLADPAVWKDVRNLKKLPDCFAGMRASSARSVHIFMPTAVPPVFLPFLSAVTTGENALDVWLYMQNPSSGFWFEGIDLEDRTSQGRLQAYLVRNAKSTRATIDRLWLFSGEDGGNLPLPERLMEDGAGRAEPEDTPWVAAAGEQPRSLAFDFVHQRIQDFRASETLQAERIYIDPAPEAEGSMLARLQSAIVNLDSTLLPDQPDRSIRLVTAPNRLREVQALCEYLQSCFQDDPALRAEDVLVASPELDAYIPLIHSVFGSLPRERSIPYRIVGAGLVQENLAVQAVVSLCDMIESRADSDAFFAWLELPLVTRNWGLDFEDLAVLRGWLRAAGFRYGISRAHMARLGREKDAEGCLESALERLALGLTQSGERVRLFAGTLPVAAASPSDYETVVSRSDLLEKLLLIAERIESMRRHFQDEGEINVTSWADTWSLELEPLFGSEQQTPELVGVRRSIGSICKQMRRGLPEGSTLPFTLFWHALKSQLGEQKAPVRQGDAVTFADMSHSRGLPFRIVAVLGLGQDSRFPGVHFTESFDLMALTDQAGNPVRRRADRDSRSDNRNVFLDLVLGARSSLYLSYCSGEGKKAGRLPSPVLTDFIELIALALGKDGVGALRAAVPLTAESMRNFHTEGGRFWRSHCPQLYESVCAAKEAAADEAPFADAGPLIAPGQMPELIDWSDLAFFWKDPDKWTLVRHGVEQEYAAAPDQTLPVVPETSALPGWAWKSRIAGLFDSGIPADEVNDIMGRDPMNGAEGVREFFARQLLDWLELCRRTEDDLQSKTDESPQTLVYPIDGALRLLQSAGIDPQPFAAIRGVQCFAAKLRKKQEEDSFVLFERVISKSALKALGLKRAMLAACGLSAAVCYSMYGEEDGQLVELEPMKSEDAVMALNVLIALYLLALSRPAPAPLANGAQEFGSDLLWRGRQEERAVRQGSSLVKTLAIVLGVKPPSARWKMQDLEELFVQEVSHAYV